MFVYEPILKMFWNKLIFTCDPYLVVYCQALLLSWFILTELIVEQPKSIVKSCWVKG